MNPTKIMCSYLFLFALLTVSASAQIPTYRAGRTMDAIRIDGKLEEFTWAAAPRVGRFHNIRNMQQKDILPTEAAVVWDDNNLYVAFACYDSEPWSTMMARDSRLWEQEVVEVFLDPDADGLNYPELEVSPHNVVVDLLIPRPRAGASDAIKWDIEGLQTAVTKHATGWVVEIAIPWKSLGGAGTDQAPRPGDRWRVGLYRIERPGGPEKTEQIADLRKQVADASGSKKAELQSRLEKLQSDLQWLAWSPTRVERGFHDPERFGIVEFVLKP